MKVSELFADFACKSRISRVLPSALLEGEGEVEGEKEKEIETEIEVFLRVQAKRFGPSRGRRFVTQPQTQGEGIS
jgi:hypothetical protein